MSKKRKAPKRKRATQRQMKLVKALAKGKTLKDAGIEAGYSGNNPAQSAHQAIKGLEKTMPELLNSLGLTDESLIEKYLKPGLLATDTEFAKFEGKITDREDVIAWGERRGYLDMAFKLKGSYAPTKQSIAAENGPLMVQIVTNFTFPDAKLRDA